MSSFAGAQTPSEPQMADALRENGKIYVVITVIGIIFVCIVAFLIILERKIKKLEEKASSPAFSKGEGADLENISENS